MKLLLQTARSVPPQWFHIVTAQIEPLLSASGRKISIRYIVVFFRMNVYVEHELELYATPLISLGIAFAAGDHEL